MNKTIARQMIKAISMQNLQGNWLRSFLIFAVSIFVPSMIWGFLPLRIPAQEAIIAAANDAEKLISLFLPETVTYKTWASIAVTVLLYLFVMEPFSVGTCRFYLKAARGEKAKLSDVFSAFTSIRTVFSSIWLSVLVFLMSAFWGFLFAMLPVAVMVISVMLKSVLLLQISMILLLIASIFAILWTSRYRFASYIFSEGKSGGAFSSLRECLRLMHGRTGECLMLRASYFGWELISAGVLPLMFIYNSLCSTVYANYLYYLRGELSIGELNTPPKI